MSIIAIMFLLAVPAAILLVLNNNRSEDSGNTAGSRWSRMCLRPDCRGRNPPWARFCRRCGARL